ncbi:4056_t:CDS:2 [Paraglomus brasilianum]|uniref:4056_t:CDS:1 n=1 Tax=Paraglomus brasilianum TaxID=144538 RepID=A0A9N9GCA3_9GLOM|nr:4056_t:CDS:2 [Paraglomus brasilianum]
MEMYNARGAWTKGPVGYKVPTYGSSTIRQVFEIVFLRENEEEW